MKREPVNSSSLKEVGYDPETRTLEILFTSGGIYSYADVPPEVHQTLMRVDSKGKYFIARIKDVYACTTLFKPEKKEKKDGKDSKTVQSGGEGRGVPDVPARRSVRHNRTAG